ncbi:MAG TPA: hypothetical protein VJ821_07990 [Anaerolineales bacterium]|nr:hypothetical protein [Anaerolineales bacterium]
MAKVQNNPVVQGLSGSIGELVFRQMPDGSTYVSKKHDFSGRKFSQGQKDHQRRFKQAVAYARQAAKSQPVYTELAKGTVLSPYNIALSDWFNPPVIHKVEWKGKSIRIQASDNVMVASVRVMITGMKGKPPEKGEAKRTEGDWWEYVPRGTGKVSVEARDLAGNVVRKEIGD